MQLHQCDAADYVLKLAADIHEGRSAPLDMVCVDAFDGNDNVPASLWSSGISLTISYKLRAAVTPLDWLLLRHEHAQPKVLLHAWLMCTHLLAATSRQQFYSPRCLVQGQIQFNGLVP